MSHVSDYTDHAYIKRVCDHIIQSVNASGTVSRVIVTSSVAAVISEMDLEEIGRRPVFYEDRYPDDANPKRTAQSQGYSMGKILAETAFAGAAEQHGVGMPLLVAPLVTWGYSVSPPKKLWSLATTCEHDARGDYEQNWVYRPWFPVDVRDNALCHIRMLESTKVKNGERYIAGRPRLGMSSPYAHASMNYFPRLNFRSEPREVHPERLQTRESRYRGLWRAADCAMSAWSN